MKDLLLKQKATFNFFGPKMLEELKEELLATKEFEGVEEFIIPETRDGLPTTFFYPEKGDKFNKRVIINSISYNGIITMSCSPDSIIKG